MCHYYVDIQLNYVSIYDDDDFDMQIIYVDKLHDYAGMRFTVYTCQQFLQTSRYACYLCVHVACKHKQVVCRKGDIGIDKSQVK